MVENVTPQTFFLIIIPNDPMKAKIKIDPFPRSHLLKLVESLFEPKKYAGNAIIFGRLQQFTVSLDLPNGYDSIFKVFAILSTYPDWFDPTQYIQSIYLKAISVSQPDVNILLARRIMFLVRTTWLLNDQIMEKAKSNTHIDDEVGLKRYPYEMAAILGLIDWKTAKDRMKADGHSRCGWNSKDEKTYSKVLTAYISHNWDTDPFVAMSMHAFEILTLKQCIIDLIPIALGLLPSQQTTFFRLGESGNFMIGALRPTKLFTGTQVNELFSLDIYNLYQNASDQPFNTAPTIIKIVDAKLEDLLTKIPTSYKIIDILYKKDRNISTILPLSWSLDDAMVKPIPHQKITSQIKPKHLVFTILDSFTKISSPSGIDNELTSRPSAPTIKSDIDSLCDPDLQLSIRQNAQAQGKNIDSDTGMQERIKLLYTIQQLANPNIPNSTILWQLAAILGLIEWKEAINKAKISTSKAQLTLSDQVVNSWIDNNAPIVNVAKQAEELFSHLISSDRAFLGRLCGTDFSDDILSMLMSLSATAYLSLSSKTLLLKLFNLASTSFWTVVGGDQDNLMVWQVTPETESFNLHIFNLEQTKEKNLLIDEYSHVPLEVLITESIEFSINPINWRHLDPVVKKSSNNWLFYPDDAYKTKDSQVKPLDRWFLLDVIEGAFGQLEATKIEIAFSICLLQSLTTITAVNSVHTLKTLDSLINTTLPSKLSKSMINFGALASWKAEMMADAQVVLKSLFDDVNDRTFKQRLLLQKAEGYLNSYSLSFDKDLITVSAIDGSAFTTRFGRTDLGNGQHQYHFELTQNRIFGLLQVSKFVSGVGQNVLNSAIIVVSQGDLIVIAYQGFTGFAYILLTFKIV